MLENVEIEKMKTYLFIEYPACGTCHKAKKWWSNKVSGDTDRHIVEQRPTMGRIERVAGAEWYALEEVFQHERFVIQVHATER